ncbi:MAG: hypothetical protein IMZ53_13005 [Thermoplasmata archaeon]|nr:hypothetical protein [Thermoplasmata archaeon]
MNKQELDVKIETLTKKQRKEIGLLLDKTGQEAFDQAITDGKTQNVATVLAEAAAVKAGEDYLLKLSIDQAVSPIQPPAPEIKKPEEVSTRKVNWGGYTQLQTETRFQNIGKEILKALPKDSEIRIMNFSGARPEDVAKGKLYRVTITGNISGIKKILV